MYPCPCGWRETVRIQCACAEETVTQDQKRTSDTLLDRIDIHIKFLGVGYEKLSGNRTGASSELGKRQFCSLQPDGQSLMRAAI